MCQDATESASCWMIESGKSHLSSPPGGYLFKNAVFLIVHECSKNRRFSGISSGKTHTHFSQRPGCHECTCFWKNRGRILSGPKRVLHQNPVRRLRNGEIRQIAENHIEQIRTVDWNTKDRVDFRNGEQDAWHQQHAEARQCRWDSIMFQHELSHEWRGQAGRER